MIKTIIFDIGNVLMKFDYMPYIRALLQDEEAVDRVNGAIWRSGFWNELDKGEKLEKILPLMLAEDPEYQDKILLTLENIGQCLRRLDYAIPWIKTMKKRGYKVLYLSNYSEFVMKAGPEVLDFLPLMDGGVFSCHAHMIKPDPAIFKKICDDYGLVPAECLFIDDTEENIKTAESLGFNAVRFEGYEESAAEIEKVLGGR